MKYDIAIIGGGPAGYTAAERAAANGLQTVLFEKKAIGGVLALYIARPQFLFVTYLIISRYAKTQT